MGKGKERRRRSRSKWLLMADVKNINSGRKYTLLTKNLSSTGVCLLGDVALERGQKLECAFDLLDRPSSVVVIGEVVWVMETQNEDVRQVEAGIKFFDVPDSVRRLLDETFEPEAD